MGFPVPTNVSGSIKASDTPLGNYSASGSVSFKTEALQPTARSIVYLVHSSCMVLTVM